jgi:hypothetical protein
MILDVDVGTMRFFANQFDDVNVTYPGTGTGQFLLVSTVDANGTNVGSDIGELIEPGDNIRIQNSDGSKVLSFTANTAAVGDTRIIMSFAGGIFNYTSESGNGFGDNERLTLINTSATSGLADDVEFNSFYNYHDHVDAPGEFCEPGRIQHFDFEYWNYGGISGNNCDIFSCPDIIYNSDYIHMGRTFISKGSAPQVIYVKGGQVLVRGTVDGMYTIVTDDFTEYRRHDDMDIIDRVWGNVWLIDDIVYADSYANGAVKHPSDGGTQHVLGLIAGGSVIIANTRPNGARGCTAGGCDININASILAMNGGFISHYWQNILTGYHDIDDGLTYGIIADGRGGHRNYYRSESTSGIYNDSDDHRGRVNLYGSIVQFQRGYMVRNYPGPYNVSPGVGYNKNYNYDWNLQLKPPPYFPDLESVDNAVILKMASYGEANTNQD